MTLKEAAPLPQGTNQRCYLCSRGFPWDQIEVSLHWNHILASVASRLLIRWSSHALPLGNPAYDSTNQYSISNYGIFLLKTLQWIPNSLSLSINYCFNWCLPTHLTSLSVNHQRRKILSQDVYFYCFFSLEFSSLDLYRVSLSISDFSSDVTIS